MDMNNPTRLIALLGASGLTGVFLAALVLVVGFPAESHDSMGATHDHTSASAAVGPTFYGEMAAVNARMHEGMVVGASGDVDRDFARMMIPHHQGAIDMALVLLKYGHDERLRRLAQSIIVEQGQEIEYMRMLQNVPAPEQSSAHPSTTHHSADP